MAWLRIDDGFVTNKKIAQLTDGELRVWMRVLCFSAEHRRQRQGHLTAADRREIAGFSPARFKRFQSLGLIDPTDVEGVVSVHDFDTYNPTDKTATERKRAERERKAAENVTRDNGRDMGRDNGRDPSHMRESPYPYPEDNSTAAGTTPANHPGTDQPAAALEAETWKILKTDLETEGWAPWQIARAEVDQPRALTALERALAEADSNAGGYAWRLFNTNGSLEKPPPKQTPRVNMPADYKPGQKLRYLTQIQAIADAHPTLTDDELEHAIRNYLEGFTGDEAEIAAHLAAVSRARAVPTPEVAA